VLDASALSGFFEDRPGVAEKVGHLLAEAQQKNFTLLMAAVNWGEVFYIAWRRHGEATAHKLEATVQALLVAIIAADKGRASRAGL
jgi:uncharacterized protein with PIN domain